MKLAARTSLHFMLHVAKLYKLRHPFGKLTRYVCRVIMQIQKNFKCKNWSKSTTQFSTQFNTQAAVKLKSEKHYV